MDVLHINCNYMTTVLHQTMTEHLGRTGVNNHVFAPVYDAALAVIKPNSNVTVAECFQKWDRLNFDYKQHKIMSALEKSIRVADFDVLHAYTLFTDGNCAMKMSKKYGIPYVVAVRSTDVNAFFKYRPWLRGRGVKIMENAAAVFFLSQRYLELTLEKYVPAGKREELRKKCSVVPNGIDSFWLSNTPVSRGREQLEKLGRKELDIIVAGRINKNKNQTTVMKAVDILNARGWNAKLTVVGGTEDEGVVQMLKQNPAVTVISAQPKEKLIDLYRQSDIFVMPSFQETFGLVYAEAMSQGLPVIYTRGQGFDGQFPEGTAGYAVKADDPEEITDRILKLLENYQTVSSRVPELAKQFNWDKIVEEYVSIYRRITIS